MTIDFPSNRHLSIRQQFQYSYPVDGTVPPADEKGIYQEAFDFLTAAGIDVDKPLDQFSEEELVLFTEYKPGIEVLAARAAHAALKAATLPKYQ
jgi:hypothetical protein